MGTKSRITIFTLIVIYLLTNSIGNIQENQVNQTLVSEYTENFTQPLNQTYYSIDCVHLVI